MFVFTYKTNKGKLIIAIIVVVVLFSLMLALIFSGIGQGTYAVSANFRYSTVAETAEERADFFKQFGWEASEEPLEVRQVLIPTDFTGTYDIYNGIQLKQGLDLKEFAGCRVKCYTYEIYNYPTDTGEKVVSNILVYQGRVIGGDVSSAEKDGFIQGFVNELALPSKETLSDAVSLQEPSVKQDKAKDEKTSGAEKKDQAAKKEVSEKNK